MNLQGDFFYITSMQSDADSAKATIELNALHRIFLGHFPGTPVVPGVCMMQMVKELVETITGRETMLSKADMMKFLVVINPNHNKTIDFALKFRSNGNGFFDVSATILIDTTVCFKFKGLFVRL